MLAPIVMAAAPSSRRAGAAPFSAIERWHGGRLGVFAHDLATGRTIAHRADERFKLYSTFKGLLAGLVLHDVAKGRERLDAAVLFGARDLIDASPVTSTHVGDGTLPVGVLCAAMMHQSDNVTANLLMRRRGGPARLTAFLRGIGDGVTRIDNYEGAIAGHPMPFDSTTPRAVAGSAAVLMSGGILPLPARRQLERWLIGNRVGGRRLRAGFPAPWVTGDRTGTGDGICNDYMFSRRPDGGLMFAAAYHEAPGMALPDQEAILRAVGRELYRWQASGDPSSIRDRR